MAAELSSLNASKQSKLQLITKNAYFASDTGLYKTDYKIDDTIVLRCTAVNNNITAFVGDDNYWYCTCTQWNLPANIVKDISLAIDIVFYKK